MVGHRTRTAKIWAQIPVSPPLSSIFIDMTKITKPALVNIIKECLNEGMNWTHGLKKKDLHKIVNLDTILDVSENDQDQIGKLDQKAIFGFIMKRMPWLINWGYQSEVDKSWYAPFAEYFGKNTNHSYWTTGFREAVDRVLNDFIYWSKFPVAQLKGAAKFNRHWIKRFKHARETLLQYPTFQKDLTDLKEYLWELDKRSASNPKNQANYPLYVSLYDSSRSYGGSEEGGWDYDNNIFIESIRVNNFKETRRAVAVLLKKMYDVVDDNPRIVLEKEEGSQSTTHKPHYS